MVNGVVYDFEDIKCQLPNGQVSTVENIKYGAQRDVDVVTDMRGIPRGTVRKEFSGDFEMDMSLAEYERLARSASRGIFALEPFPVVISIGGGDKPIITDTITVKITEAPREWKKGEELMMTVKGKQTAIPKFNGRPVYVPGA